MAVDMLRVLACCAVVGLHTFSKDATPLASVLYYACGCAVPVFFMLSGFFLLNRGKVGYSYAFRKIGRMGVVICLWVTIATLPRALGLAVLGRAAALAAWPGDFLASFIGTVMQSGMLPQLWFLWSLAIVYLLLPLLSRLGLRGKVWLLVLLCFAGLVVQVASYMAYAPLESYVPQTFRVWIWIKYFLLGGLLYQARDRFEFSRLVAVLLMLILSVLAVCWQLFVGTAIIPEADGVAHAEYFYDSILFVVWCAVLLAAAESIRPTSTRWVSVGSLTMGVYIIHMLVLCAFNHIFSVADPVFGSGVRFLVVLGISFACIRLIRPTKLFDVLCRV